MWFHSRLPYPSTGQSFTVVVLVLVLDVKGLGHPRLGAWFEVHERIALSSRFEHPIDGQVRSSCMPICLACLDLEIIGRRAFARRVYRRKDVRARTRLKLT